MASPHTYIHHCRFSCQSLAPAHSPSLHSPRPYKPGGEKHEFWSTDEGVVDLPITNHTHLTLIIHGFSESSHRPWIRRLSDALLSVGKEERVVVVVDYWDLHTINYLQMRHNARQVASLIAHLIDTLVVHKSLQLAHTHVIGFSMGGRISGMVGSKLTTGQLGRITALDPSYPILHPVDPSETLDQNDAQLVVVLRTSLVAYYNPPGHVDFYPNGGIVQPGCDVWFYPDIVQQSCSHFRAVKLGVEAVRRGQQQVFPSCGCDSWGSFANNSCDCLLTSNFDLTTYSSVGGPFYLTTNSDPPYTIPFD
ncbi:lipase member H-like isoform X2 [Homarus americanus]|uniref:lipase member H-like isoform X2 n=1 Tax=Homarus americanus TaxID=6706 RepID=UPI001C44A685|nr:lipase member H-like isoform X2 [Homarus americanus]